MVIYLVIDTWDDGDEWEEDGEVHVDLVGAFRSKEKAEEARKKHPESYIIEAPLDKIINKTVDTVDYHFDLYDDPMDI